MEDMQKVKERAEKVARDALAEAKGLREPLEAAIIDNKELKRQMSNYDRDKAALAVSRPDILVVNLFRLSLKNLIHYITNRKWFFFRSISITNYTV